MQISDSSTPTMGKLQSQIINFSGGHRMAGSKALPETSASILLY